MTRRVHRRARPVARHSLHLGGASVSGRAERRARPAETGARRWRATAAVAAVRHPQLSTSPTRRCTMRPRLFGERLTHGEPELASYVGDIATTRARLVGTAARVRAATADGVRTWCGSAPNPTSSARHVSQGLERARVVRMTGSTSRARRAATTRRRDAVDCRDGVGFAVSDSAASPPIAPVGRPSRPGRQRGGSSMSGANGARPRRCELRLGARAGVAVFSDARARFRADALPVAAPNAVTSLDAMTRGVPAVKTSDAAWRTSFSADRSKRSRIACRARIATTSQRSAPRPVLLGTGISPATRNFATLQLGPEPRRSWFMCRQDRRVGRKSIERGGRAGRFERSTRARRAQARA